MSGRSSPSAARVPSIWAGVASGPSITATGSPGIGWISRKTIVTTTAMTGITARRRRARYAVMTRTAGAASRRAPAGSRAQL